MKIIGLDVGTVRIGVSKADSQVKIAVPAGMVPVDGQEFEQIARLARVYGTNFFVIGLPRNNSGEETRQSKYVREFAETLQAKMPDSKLCFQDESWTSVEAEERLKMSAKNPKSRKKDGDVDSEAAVIILQDFLEHFAEKTGSKLPKEAKKKTSKALEKEQKKNGKGKIALIALGLIALFMGGLLAGAAIWYNVMLAAVEEGCCSNDCGDADVACATCEESSECGAVKVKIEEGSGTAAIAKQLEEAGAIRSALVFQIYTKLNGLEGQYRAGDYEFEKGMDVPRIAQKLVEGASTANVFRFTILPGERISDVKKSLVEAGYNEVEIEAAFAANYEHPVLAGRPDGAGLEGYIYGETYEFYVGESVENIIKRTLDELYKVVKENNLEEKYAAHGLSLYEGIVLASVVQKEAKTNDMPTVAQVFLSRLSNGMVLGSDVTTQYALDQVDPDRTVYTDNQKALKVEECHNTRLYAGLPCGAISNPGKAALLAVGEPSETSYLYFLTGDDSMMYYSSTEAEHVQNIRDHCQVLCNTAL